MEGGFGQEQILHDQVIEHRQGLVGVGGDDDVVEAFDPALAIADFDKIFAAVHGGDAGGETDAVGISLRQALHIGAAAAEHGAPRRPVAHA